MALNFLCISTKNKFSIHKKVRKHYPKMWGQQWKIKITSTFPYLEKIFRNVSGHFGNIFRNLSHYGTKVHEFTCNVFKYNSISLFIYLLNKVQFVQVQGAG